MAVRDMTLRQRTIGLVALMGVLLTLLAVFAAGTAATNRRHLDRILDKTGPMWAAGERLNAALVEQETGIRGYALSGNPAELALYQHGLAEEARLIEQIHGLVGRLDDGVRAQLEVVRSGSARWRTEVADPVVAAVQADKPQAGRAIAGDQDRIDFDDRRAAVERLRDEILASRARSVAAARDTSELLVLTLVIAAVLIIFAGVAFFLLLDRKVTRPLLDLAAQVRHVADGDYERRISSVGAPELSRLAVDVDGMRRRIAAELTEVREARAQVEWVNQQLQSQAEELTRSNRDLEQFAYVASHDLQEPLRKVASFCQLLQRRYAGQLDERADQYIAFAVDGAQRMQRLINDLLAFSRIGRLTSGFADVDLDQVLRDVGSQLQSRVDGGEVTWSGLPTVEGEEPLLTTLFVNLVGNSLKFRRPDVPPRVTVSARRDDGFWEITVRDNGIGIEPEFADRVFVIFKRLHGRDAYEGTGIGLAIVKKIVEYHGGRIWLDPEVRDGTAIRFTLPAAPDTELPDTDQSVAEEV